MPYVPNRGDFVWLTFDPQAGHEQAGRRPALTLSPAAYNGLVGLAIFCPVTNQIKGYPFEVRIPDGLAVTGVVLSDQARSLDWGTRKAAFICEAPEDVVTQTLLKLQTILADDAPSTSEETGSGA